MESNTREKDALELFRELVLRLPVGPHLSMNMINCLFRLVERQHHSLQEGRNEEILRAEENNALLALEILCDVMSKKYIPRVEGQTDEGAAILVELIANAIGLLQQMRSVSFFAQ